MLQNNLILLMLGPHLCDSGMCRLLSVAMAGKYIPRASSRTMKAMKATCLMKGQ